MSWLMDNTVAEANLATKFLPRLSKLSLQGVRSNSYEPSGMLIVGKVFKLAINKQRLKTVLLTSNTKLAFSPAFLQQNAILAFTSCTFQCQNAKFASSLKLCQNTKFASYFKNVRYASA